MTERSRVQAGVPTGGQFAAEAKGENPDLAVPVPTSGLTDDDRVLLARLMLGTDGVCDSTDEYAELISEAADCGAWAVGRQTEPGSRLWDTAAFSSYAEAREWLGLDTEPSQTLVVPSPGTVALTRSDGRTVILASPGDPKDELSTQSAPLIEGHVFYDAEAPAASRFAQVAADTWGTDSAVLTVQFGSAIESRVLVNLDPGQLAFLRETEPADTLTVFSPKA